MTEASIFVFGFAAGALLMLLAVSLLIAVCVWASRTREPDPLDGLPERKDIERMKGRLREASRQFHGRTM